VPGAGGAPLPRPAPPRPAAAPPRPAPPPPRRRPAPPPPPPAWYCSICLRDTTRLSGQSTLKSSSSTCHAGAMLLRITSPGRAWAIVGEGGRGPAPPGLLTGPARRPRRRPAGAARGARGRGGRAPTHRLARRRGRQRGDDELRQAAGVERVLEVVEPRVRRDAAGARGELQQAAQARPRHLGRRPGQLVLGSLQQVDQQVALRAGFGGARGPGAWWGARREPAEARARDVAGRPNAPSAAPRGGRQTPRSHARLARPAAQARQGSCPPPGPAGRSA
jgi:hypothetical protein